MPYQEITTVEQLEKALHGEPTYSLTKKNLDVIGRKIEDFISACLRLYKKGRIVAVYDPARTDYRLKIASNVPGKSVANLVLEQELLMKTRILKLSGEWRTDPNNSSLLKWYGSREGFMEDISRLGK